MTFTHYLHNIVHLFYFLSISILFYQYYPSDFFINQIYMCISNQECTPLKNKIISLFFDETSSIASHFPLLIRPSAVGALLKTIAILLNYLLLYLCGVD